MCTAVSYIVVAAVIIRNSPAVSHMFDDILHAICQKGHVFKLHSTTESITKKQQNH